MPWRRVAENCMVTFWGTGGPEFKSRRSDQEIQTLSQEVSDAMLPKNLRWAAIGRQFIALKLREGSLMGQVRLEGEAPYDLPATQRASAHAAGDIVELTLYVPDPEQGSGQVPVRTAMIADVALIL